MRGKHHIVRGCVYIAVAVAFAGDCPGLDPRQPVNSYLRRQFTTTDGLPIDIINGLAQAGGFLWVATPTILVRFDGRHFVEIHLAPRLGSLSVLATGPEGDLWVGSSAGLARVRSRYFNQLGPLPVELYPGSSVQSLRVARNGVLWVGTARGLSRFNGHGLDRVIASESVSHVEEMRDGHLIVVTGKEVIEWDGERVVPLRGPIAGLNHADTIYHVLEDRAGVLWIASTAGVTREDHGRIAHLRVPGEHSKPSPVFRVFEESNGKIWVVTSRGVQRLTDNLFEPLEPVTGGRSLLEDEDGNLWIGTNGSGLVRLRTRLVSTVGRSSGLPNDVVTAVLTAHDGTLWVGNNCAFNGSDASGGVSRFDGAAFRTYNEKDGLTSSCVTSLAEDAGHDLWVGTYGGIFRLHGSRFTRYWKPEGLGDDGVRQLSVAADQSVWLATGEGVSQFRNSSFRNYGVDDGLSKRGPYSLFLSRTGTIWVGVPDGIQRFDGSRFVDVAKFDDLGLVLIVGESSDGTLFLQTQHEGLARLTGGSTVTLTGLDGLAMTYALPNVWLAGSIGIQRTAAASIEKWLPRDGPLDFVTYDNLDGANSLSVFYTAAITPDGRLWVPTTRGLAVLDIAHPPRMNPKPRTYVAGVTVDRRIRTPGEELVLPPGLHHVEINFDTVELSSPEHTRLQYRLEGVDDEWFDAGQVHAAVYTTIPLGRHRFRIRATNRGGIWDREGITYWITQKPFYYETSYFRTALACGGILFLIGLYRLRLRQSAANVRAHMQGKQFERERIARELHDTLLQAIQGLILLFEATTKRMPSGDPIKHSLEEALAGASNVIAEGRNRVHELRNVPDAASDLTGVFCRMAEEATGSTNIELRVTAEGKHRMVKPGVLEEAYWIARESVVNALTHSGATRIDIELTYGRRDLSISIRDNGRGVNAEVLKVGGKTGHWGITGMRERAAKIGAAFAIYSEPMIGTTICLRIPARFAYAWAGETALRRRLGRGLTDRTE